MRPTWGFDEGDEIAPGRTVLRQLGGGRRYEVFLVWDDHRLAVLVAKVLRPDQAADAVALRELEREAEALDAARPPGDRARVRRRDRRALPAPADRAPRGADAVRADPRRRRAGARAGAAARSPRRRGAALPRRRGHGPPRRQAGEHRHGRAAAADRPQRGAAGRRGAASAHADRHRRATWRPSSAIRRAARSARRPTCSASPPRSSTRSAAAARSRARARSASRSARAIPRPCPAASRARSPISSARGSRAIPPHGRPRPSSPPGSSRWWRRCRAGSCSAARGSSAFTPAGWGGWGSGRAASFVRLGAPADPRRTRLASCAP